VGNGDIVSPTKFEADEVVWKVVERRLIVLVQAEVGERGREVV
jgi:hypothetical protein